MRYVKRSDYERMKKSKDYCTLYSDWNGEHPEWKGRVCLMLPGRDVVPGESLGLYVEGVGFTVVEDSSEKAPKMFCVEFLGSMGQKLIIKQVEATHIDEVANWARKQEPLLDFNILDRYDTLIGTYHA